MKKRTLLATGLIALCLNATNALAQQTDGESTNNPNYNTRLMHMRLSYGIGGGDWFTQGLGLGVFAKVQPKLYAGISGYYYGDMGGRANIQQMIPLSAEVQYEFGTTEKGNGAMLVGTAVGYNFVLNGVSEPAPHLNAIEIKNGLYFNPSIGYRLNFSKNTGILFDLGYQLVQGKEVDFETKLVNTNHVQHNILFKAGLFF